MTAVLFVGQVVMSKENIVTQYSGLTPVAVSSTDDNKVTGHAKTGRGRLHYTQSQKIKDSSRRDTKRELDRRHGAEHVGTSVEVRSCHWVICIYYMMTSFILLHFAWNSTNHFGGTCGQLMSQVGEGKTGSRLRWSIPL